METIEIQNKLQEILNTNTAHNNTRLKNLLILLALEDEILSSTKRPIKQLVRQALVTSTPLDLYHQPKVWLPSSLEDMDNVLKVTSLVISPLIETLSHDEKTDFINGITNLIRDTSSMGEDVYYPYIMERFTPNRDILESPMLLKYFIRFGGFYISLTISWALLNDTTLLFPLTAELFDSHVKDMNVKFPLSVLSNYLHTNNIDESLFWDLTKAMPNLPALSLLEKVTSHT